MHGIFKFLKMAFKVWAKRKLEKMVAKAVAFAVKVSAEADAKFGAEGTNDQRWDYVKERVKAEFPKLPGYLQNWAMETAVVNLRSAAEAVAEKAAKK